MRKEAWREPYKAAAMELDPAEARKKIDLACLAILQRIDELADARDTGAGEKQLEILDSLHNLLALQRVVPPARTHITGRSAMTRRCRNSPEASWRRRRIAWTPLRPARIVTDPNLLAYLNAEVENRKRSTPAPPSCRCKR